MAKTRHNQQPQETSARGTLIFLTIGALLVAGLVVWALTRTVEPSTTSTTAGYVSTTQPVTPPMTTAQTTSPTTSPTTPTASSPIASTTAGIATTSAAPVISGDRKEVPRISAEDLREKSKAGSVTIVDVRDATSYATDHIAGSLHIPLASIEANLDQLPKGKPIVTYCT
jgi:cytoskeletal protein RodZ